MFKNIFDAKIGEKLNNFNNLSKAAVSSVNFSDWTDKFRQTIDISEKIQNFNFNDIQNSINGNSNNSNNNLNENIEQCVVTKTNTEENNKNSSSQTSSKNKKEKENFHSKEKKSNSYDEENTNSSNFPRSKETSNNLSISNFPSPKNSFKFNNKNAISKQLSNQNSFNTSMQSSNDEIISESTSGSLSQKSSNDLNTPTCNKITTEDELVNDEPRLEYSKLVRNPSINSSNTTRTLVRQSTDITTSFPLKPFQKINSETIEIPGLNVKVVRYRVENDLGKIDPHLYKSYNSSIDPTTAITKGKLFFSLYYNEEIKSLSVTINKAEIFNVYGNTNAGCSNTSVVNSPNLNKPDTYVKIQLLPDKKKKFQTKVQRKTWTPVYEETFYFQLDIEDLKTRTLFLTHLESGRFSKHELIGAVRYSILLF
jgi:hypothetical protein